MFWIGPLNHQILIQLNIFRVNFKKRTVHPKNKSELEAAVKEEWLKIPYETLEKLIESMPRRIEVCISNDGWPTRY